MSWRTYLIADIADVVTKGTTPTTFGKQFTDNGIHFIKAEALNGDSGLDRGGFSYIDEDTHELLRRSILREEDVLITIAGANVGRCGFVRAEDLPANTNQAVGIVRVNPAKAFPRFVYYFFKRPSTFDYCQSLGGQAAQPNVNLTVLKSIAVLLPSLAVQQKVAATLSAYDDLIENNRRRMKLLEEAARQLYREWFVRLRFPGYEHTPITNGVPEGWERRVLVDACESLEDGDWIESKDQGGEDYRLLQISNIGVNEFVETGNFRYITDETFKRLNCREIRPGQILISRMPKPIGRAWLVTEMPWRMITAVDVAIVATNDDLADAYFLMQFLNSPESLEHCERRAVGATRLRVARRELASLPVLLPPRKLQQLFREVAEPSNQQRANLYRQNERLRAARDLLLPRLMSGQLIV